MPVTTFYMLYARGVMFELFFAVISIFSLLYLFKSNAAKKYLLLYVIVNIAGIYAMPSHLYFLLLQVLVAVIYMARSKIQLLRPFLLCNMLVLLIAFICYLPVIAGSGISFILHPAINPALVNETTADLLFYNKGISTFFTGYPYGLFLVLAITIILLIVFKRATRHTIAFIFFALLLYVLPSGIYFVQHNTVTERAIAFTGLILPICFCVIVFAFKNNFTPLSQGVFISLLFITGCIISARHRFLLWSAEKDKKAITISSILMQRRVETCYDNSPGSGFAYYYPSLEYYYSLKGLYFNLTTSAVNSQRYKPLMAADNYDCMVANITDTTFERSKSYVVVYKDTADRFKMMVRK